MSMKQTFYRSVAVTGLAGLLGAAPAQLNAQSTIAINNDDIGGVVRPERAGGRYELPSTVGGTWLVP
jgi:hypothetical protein